MKEKVNNDQEKVVDTQQEQTNTIEEIKNSYTIPNMDSYSSLINLADNDIYFSLIQGGDIVIKANSTRDLLNRDIVSLCNNSNVFFVGTDGRGSHSRIFIKNPNLRVYVGFDSEDGTMKQEVLNDDVCQKILDTKSQEQFEKIVKEKIVSYHEKVKIMNYAKKVKLNDFDKIVYLEKHTEKKFRV